MPYRRRAVKSNGHFSVPLRLVGQMCDRDIRKATHGRGRQFHNRILRRLRFLFTCTVRRDLGYPDVTTSRYCPRSSCFDLRMERRASYASLAALGRISWRFLARFHRGPPVKCQSIFETVLGGCSTRTFCPPLRAGGSRLNDASKGSRTPAARFLD